jgi:zinc and cadmium transporter
MPLIVWIVAFTALGGILSTLVAAFFLLLSPEIRARLLPTLISFAIGALLGAAFLAILPDALKESGQNVHGILAAVLLGLLLFFLLEKIVLWRHCHIDPCEAHAPLSARTKPSSAGYLILVGDSIHNFVDGVLVASAFFADIHLGIVTSLAVVAHEIPQELGDFVVLLHSGFSQGKALFYNMLSSLAMVLGGIVAYFSLSWINQAVPYVLAIAASSFIYIAVADLIPGLHKRVEIQATIQQIVLIFSWVATIFIADLVLH